MISFSRMRLKHNFFFWTRIQRVS